MLRKNPGFTAVAVLSLALGIGANTTIFTVVNAILLNALPVRDLPRLVQLDTVDSKTLVTQAKTVKLGMSVPNFKDYRRENQVLTDLAAILPTPLTWSGGAEPRQVQGELVSANYFDVLGMRPALGRFFMADEDTKPSGNDVAVLSYYLWANKLGADPGIVGKSLIFDARPYTVIGVAPRGFKGTLTFLSSEQVWIPTSMKDQILGGKEKEFFDDRRALTLLTVGRLKPGVEITAAEASLRTMATHLESEFPKDNSGRSVALTPLAEAAVGANDHKQIALAGSTMMGIVGLVLLIACVNLANLLLAQGARRQKEISLRAALGANRSRIVRQMLTESMMLALAGGVVGLAIAYAGRSILWSFRPPFIEQSGVDLVARFARAVIYAGRCDSHRVDFWAGAGGEGLASGPDGNTESRRTRRHHGLEARPVAQPAGYRRDGAGADCAGGRGTFPAQHAERAENRPGLRI